MLIYPICAYLFASCRVCHPSFMLLPFHRQRKHSQDFKTQRETSRDSKLNREMSHNVHCSFCSRNCQSTYLIDSYFCTFLGLLCCQNTTSLKRLQRIRQKMNSRQKTLKKISGFPSVDLRSKANQIHHNLEFCIMLLISQINKLCPVDEASESVRCEAEEVIAQKRKTPIISKFLEESTLWFYKIKVVGSMG